MRARIISIAIILFVVAGFASAYDHRMRIDQQPLVVDSADEGEEKGQIVDLKADVVYPINIDGDSTVYCLVGNFVAHHNGAVIVCDSAVRYSDKRIECFGNVLINQGTTYVYGERAEYNGEINEAEVHSQLVKVVDEDVTLYTYKFKFNTLESIGVFADGGVVTKDDNMLESDRGYFYADNDEIICVDNVQMTSDEYQMTGDSVIYNIETDRAQFFTHTNIWNDKGEYLYADRGSYDKADEVYIITQNGYILTENEEVWSDSLDYYRERGYGLMRHNIQLDDRSHKMVAFGDWGEYWKEPGNALLTKEPSAISYDLEQGDSVFMRADTMMLFSRSTQGDRLEAERKKQEEKLAAEQARIADSIKAAEAAIAAQDSLKQADKEAPKEKKEDNPAKEDTKRSRRDRGHREEKAADSEKSVETEKSDVAVQPSEKRAEPAKLAEPKKTTQSAHSSKTVESAKPHSAVPTSDKSLKEKSAQTPNEVKSESAAQPSDNVKPQTPSASAKESVAKSDVEVRTLDNADRRLPSADKSREVEMNSIATQKAERDTDNQPSTSQLAVPDSITATLDNPTIAQDSLGKDSLGGTEHIMTAADSLAARLDTLPKDERKALLKEIARKEREKVSAEKKRVKDSVDNVKAKIKKALLDSIGEVRQQKKNEILDRLKAREDSLMARAKAREEARKLKMIARLTRKGVKLEWADSASRAQADSILGADYHLYDSLYAQIYDSLFADKADSLLDSLVKIDTAVVDTQYRLVLGYRNVKIFRSDFQAVCDSLSSSSLDSIIHMYIEPILWHQQNQVTSEVVDMYTANQQIVRAEFTGKPMMISKIDTLHYNQVAGKTMISYFRDNSIYRNDVDGNARTIYYMQEEGSPDVQGLMYIESADMTFYMEDQTVSGITYRGSPTYTIYPMDKIPETQSLFLEGFAWHDNRRPAQDSVFKRTLRPSIRATKESLPRPEFPISKRIGDYRARLVEGNAWRDRNDILTHEVVEWLETQTDWKEQTEKNKRQRESFGKE